MKKQLHGVHVPHRKNTAELEPVHLPLPDTVEIPMSMHIGAPAKPVVKPGDTVKIGQLIAEAGGFVSAPIYASISGTVKKIGEKLLSNGRMVPTIVIQSDGTRDVWEGIEPPKIETMQDFLNAVRASGMVGLGGAGFPTVVKLTVKDLEQVSAVIINGAECEPYITSDTRTMLDRSQDVYEGAKLVQKFFQVPRVIFAIEDNKPSCIRLYRKLLTEEEHMEVCALPSSYPQGGEKVLIYNTLGETVPEGKLPLDVGAIVLNCTTLANIASYCRTGMPLVEKCVTVDGSAVQKPKNVIVPIGMSMKDVFEQAGGFCAEPKKILYGGPMMGIAVPDLDQPILKSTNAILAMAEADADVPEPTACIRCGRCIAHCPLRLQPAELEMAYQRKDVERLKELKVNLCMECGSCSFGCPANRPLVQTNKLAKAMLAAYNAQQKAMEEMRKANQPEGKEAPKA
ncbi:MAG: electron transport complex subunit RsxC [Clostridia bacterium]|nr:electron transport complex subunit RsxC [Clostridia bacterium]